MSFQPNTELKRSEQAFMGQRNNISMTAQREKEYSLNPSNKPVVKMRNFAGLPALAYGE